MSRSTDKQTRVNADTSACMGLLSPLEGLAVNQWKCNNHQSVTLLAAGEPEHGGAETAITWQASTCLSARIF